ncbi:DUF397 domain-containing protein [Actinomadura oligospora]|uniref:DUF397 domain-containing protein n=1 Tax=Actinomadura oligospora TaxID=111804 RepID=UPI001FE0F2F4|nr:DUF397 domain-containing protein [Actinomadura oligospora]
MWRKSKRSNNGGNCVEVADFQSDIGIRDSKAPGAGRLTLSRDGWAALTVRAKSGDLDL